MSMKNPTRTVVIHAHDPAYAKAVSDHLDVGKETVFVHPARLIADPEMAERAANGWLDVADKIFVYLDVELDDAGRRRVKTARIFGGEIEQRWTG